MLVISLMAVSAGCTNSLFVDERELTQGGVDGFQIGMTKRQVLDVAREEGVAAIRPVVPWTTSASASDASSLRIPGRGRALELAGSQGRRVVFLFGDCDVVNVRSAGDWAEAWTTFIGRPSGELLSSLKAALLRDHSLSVREVVSSENQASFALDSSPGGNSGSVEAYDVWDFEIGTTKPSGSHFVIYFSEGQVSRITYKRARIRLD
jgi:hypothetical protein